MATKKERVRAERQKQKLLKSEKERRQRILKSKLCCSLCGEWIPYTQKRKHLAKNHDLVVEDTRQYFKTVKDIRIQKRDAEIGKQMREQYEKNLLIDKSETYTCGETVSGPPFVRIIYNPVGTNRRKH